MTSSVVRGGGAFLSNAGFDWLDELLGKFFVAEAPTNVLGSGTISGKGLISIAHNLPPLWFALSMCFISLGYVL